MRYDDFRRSDNIEDRRDDDSGGYGGGGGGFGIPIGGGGGLGIGTIIVLGLLGWAVGIDPRILIGGAEILTGGGGAPSVQMDRPTQSSAKREVPKDQMGDFISASLGSMEDRWTEIFRERNARFSPPRVVLFKNVTNGGRCGRAQSAMGPFYCPPDRLIYLDTGFFREVETRFRGCSGSACKFTAAYIIAHEFGHHIQNEFGFLDRVRQAQQQVGDRAEANRLQVRVELQADCYAGVWANRQQKKSAFIEPGDIEAALQTANAIGDDTLQRQAQGRVVPDSFTHGSAEQRKRWFMTGYEQGSLDACNTFAQGVRL
jgi:predicted metalloprotease